MLCVKINKDSYERRALVYLDMISWLESKFKNVPLKEVIKLINEDQSPYNVFD